MAANFAMAALKKKVARLEAELTGARADTARVDFLESQSNGDPWIARCSTSGRGYRLHNSTMHGGSSSAREAIDEAMREAAGE